MSAVLTALFGAPLLGNKWVKQIHVDEAGTSRWDRRAVVAAVIIDGDRDFRTAEERIAQAIQDHIPECLRDGFIFHAKDIFGKHKRAMGWELSKCYEITEAWLEIVYDLNFPVITAWCEKISDEVRNERPYFTEASNTLAHIGAFTICFQKCDEFLADYCPGEVGSVVAEDCPQMKKLLKKMIKGVVQGDFKGVGPFHERPISHIKNAAQWCDKDEAVLLQLADVCAYSFKHYVTRQSGGDRLYSAMRGRPEFIIRQDWTNTPVGFMANFWTLEGRVL